MEMHSEVLANPDEYPAEHIYTDKTMRTVENFQVKHSFLPLRCGITYPNKRKNKK